MSDSFEHESPAGRWTEERDAGVSRSLAMVRPVVAGVGAWAVSLAPLLFAHGSPLLAKALVVLSCVFLLGSLVIERWSLKHARVWAVWSFSASAGFAWAVAGHVPGRPDTVHGVLGALAWGLFAYACAAPAIENAPADSTEDTLVPRQRVSRTDAVLLGMASLVAILLQAFGWGFVPTERALLVRVTTLGSGVILVSAALLIVLERKVRRESAPERRRTRVVRTSLAVVALVAVLGGAWMLLR